MKKSKQIAFCGMLAALSLALMFLGSVIYAFTYVAPFFCSVIMLIICDVIGKRNALITFVAVSIIALQLSRESYLMLLSSTLILAIPLQLEKAPYPMVVTELGIVILVKLEQPLKALPSTEVTELGMVTEARLLQPIKAYWSIEVTEFGMVIEVRLLHPQKVY